MPVQRACRVVRLSRTAYYQPPVPASRRDAAVIAALTDAVVRYPRWGFWKLHDRLRAEGRPWNHKRLHRVYCALRLNLPRRTTRRVPRRVRQPLTAPPVLNRTWALDFMTETLYDRRRIRLLTVIDEGNREGLQIAMGVSLPSRRVTRVLSELVVLHGCPSALRRTDNGPEFGTDAPICQDTPSGGLDDLLTSAEVGHDALVNLSCEEAFQAADDVAFGPASGEASGDVVAGRLVELHPDDDGSIEGRVGVSVAASIEAVPTGGHPRRGRDRAGAAELREGGLRTNPVGVIAEDDQQLSRGVGAHTEALAEGR